MYKVTIPATETRVVEMDYIKYAKTKEEAEQIEMAFAGGYGISEYGVDEIEDVEVINSYNVDFMIDCVEIEEIKEEDNEEESGVTIKTKYKIGDKLFYCRDNKLLPIEIIGIKIECNKNNTSICYEVYGEDIQGYKSGMKYVSVCGKKVETQLFRSLDEYIEYVKNINKDIKGDK